MAAFKNCINKQKNFQNKCFKNLTDNIQAVKGTTGTVEKKILLIVLPCL